MDTAWLLDQTLKRPDIFDEFDFSKKVQIGRGSYGHVYKVTSKNARRGSKCYALKEVELGYHSPSTCRELALYREVKHPNIMSLLRSYLSFEQSKAWLLFDYAEFDLHSLIKYYRNTELLEIKMPYVIMKSCIYQIIVGVKYLHDNWILHRDLKPENVLVMGEGPERGFIKITDLGMARLFNSPMKPLGELDLVVVTSWYRPPEILLGAKHYTKAVDVFSLGCIFAEILTTVPLLMTFPDSAPPPTRSPYQRNQLDRIFYVLGYPTHASWPEMKHMPEYPRMTKEISRFKYANCNLSKYMKTHDIVKGEPTFNLLTHMLYIDPKKRISCEAALKHKYFTEPPKPLSDVFTMFGVGTLPFPRRKYMEIQPNEPSITESKIKNLRRTLQERNV